MKVIKFIFVLIVICFFSCEQKKNTIDNKIVFDLCYSWISDESLHSTQKALSELKLVDADNQQANGIITSIEFIQNESIALIAEIELIEKSGVISKEAEGNIDQLKQDLGYYIIQLSECNRYLASEYKHNREFQYVVSAFRSYEIHASLSIDSEDKTNLTKFKIITLLMCDHIYSCIFRECAI